jgi:branched-chain amino acid transport system permease protein
VSAYLLHLLIMICIYIILGLSLNLIVGYSGMLSLCHAAFFGIGAYASTLLVTSARWPYWLSQVATVLICGLIAYLISIPSTQLRGDFFILATIAFQIIISAVFSNWISLTNGLNGISGIPPPNFFGQAVVSDWSYFLLVLFVTLAVFLLVWRLSQSPYGRVLQATRDDELAAQALGKNVRQLRQGVFTIGGMLASLSGILFAGYTSYIDPTSFTLDESIFILCIVVIGGTGNLRGPITGAFCLVLFPELIRFLSIPNAFAANARQTLYGFLLIMAMRLRPQGIAGKYAFD